MATFSFFGTLTMNLSCSNSDKQLRYEIPLYSGPVDVTIPLTSDTTISDNLTSAPNYINVDSVIKAATNNQLSSINITNVRHLATRLILLSGSESCNFANFTSCHVSFYSSANDYPYTVSVLHNPNITAYTMDFPVDANDELKSYMISNVFHYSVAGRLRRTAASSVRCRIETHFIITVNN